ncbi:MAG TPA: RtcB family protein [Labilithrix sp.]|nr:RtcB family protein [Labilithrix sp.]
MARVLFDPGRGHRVPIHVWARDASAETLAQLERIASRPYATLRVAAMADAHVAEGVAVGTVFATERTVVPRALGGDLGCGVSAIRLSVAASDLDRATLDRVVAAMVRAIPAGDAIHRGRGLAVPDAVFEDELSTRSLERTRDALTARHLGTLGGGNHFLEIDRDAEDGAWLLVHSGSRGLGAAVAAHHLRAAEAVDPDPLAGLDTESAAGQAYLADLAWALAFARWNREALARRAMSVLSDVLARDITVVEEVDIHHNFVARERWDDRDLFVHRKGAVAVPRGSPAIVPGSMATASYLVSGLGCDLAFGSCSHGAGRVMTRKEARARVPPAALSRAMRRIAWPAHLARHLVEEAPVVYRDIGDVLDDQRDLVTRERRLEPIAVLKG